MNSCTFSLLGYLYSPTLNLAHLIGYRYSSIGYLCSCAHVLLLLDCIPVQIYTYSHFAKVNTCTVMHMFTFCWIVYLDSFTNVLILLNWIPLQLYKCSHFAELNTCTVVNLSLDCCIEYLYCCLFYLFLFNWLPKQFYTWFLLILN